MSDINNITGIDKPTRKQMPQISDRMSFIYLEHCILKREDGALAVWYEDGIVCIPSTMISVLFLGPGVDVTSKAMGLMSDSGICAVWVGEHGVRYYAHGRSLNGKTNYLEKQAYLFGNTRGHLYVVKKMYNMRFCGEDISDDTLQQLRGKEGARMRLLYRNMANKYGVNWNGRRYDPDNFYGSDPVNMALSAGNICLYGLATAVITALGCSPGLGFIHVGHELSFSYDIADLYKAEYTIPLAFELGSKNLDNIESVVRHTLRDLFADSKLIERMVKDIRYLLDIEDKETSGPLYLWNNLRELAQYGIIYRERKLDDSIDVDKLST